MSLSASQGIFTLIQRGAKNGFLVGKASPRELELGFEPVAAPTSRITDTLISQLTLADSVSF